MFPSEVPKKFLLLSFIVYFITLTTSNDTRDKLLPASLATTPFLNPSTKSHFNVENTAPITSTKSSPDAKNEEDSNKETTKISGRGENLVNESLQSTSDDNALDKNIQDDDVDPNKILERLYAAFENNDDNLQDQNGPSTKSTTASSTTVSTSTVSSTTPYSRRLGGSKRIDLSWLFPAEEMYEDGGILGIQNKSNFGEIMKKADKFFRNTIEEVIRAGLPHILRLFHSVEISPDCMGGLLRLVDGVRNLKGWALRMVDSNGFYAGGFLHGTVTSVGDYDMCVNVKADHPRSKDPDDILFVGQFCPIDINPILPPKKRPFRPELLFEGLADAELKLIKELGFLHLLGYLYIVNYRTAVCVPSTCTRDDIQAIATAIADLTNALNITVPRCETKDDGQEIDGPIIFCLTVVFATCTAVLIATIVDLIHQTFFSETRDTGVNKEKGLLLEICQAFSFTRNGRKLFDLNTSPDTKHMRFLHGIRFFSIAWVILGHTYYYINMQFIGGLVNVQSLGSDVWFQLILNGTFSVDAFLLISGFLVVYIGFQKMDQLNGRFSYIVFYIHRIWRLSPLYYFIIAITFTLPLLGNGPVWKDFLGDFVGTCRDKWWTNLLYINNFVRQKDMCLSPTWYLAVSFQYFLITPPILTTLYRKPAIGMTILLFLTLLSMALSGILTVLWKLPPTGVFTQPDIDERNDYLVYMYQMPYNHGGPYFIGMALGYYLYKNPNIKMSKLTKCVGWIMSTVLALSVIFSIYPWNRGDNLPYSLGAVYSAFSRTVWGISLAWVVLVCFTGNGGLVNSLLSLKPFILLGRLTYAVYLNHILIIFAYAAFARNVYYFTHTTAIFHWSGFMYFSYGLGILCTLFFESPFIALESLFFSKLKKRAGTQQKLSTSTTAETSSTEIDPEEGGRIEGPCNSYLARNMEIGIAERKMKEGELMRNGCLNMKPEEIKVNGFNTDYIEEILRNSALEPNSRPASRDSPVKEVAYTCRL